MEELKAVIESTRGDCIVHWLPLSQLKKSDGWFEWAFNRQFNPRAGGMYAIVETIFLDQESPVVEMTSVWFHELGHKQYCDSVARNDWNDLDNELAAMTSELRETLAGSNRIAQIVCRELRRDIDGSREVSKTLSSRTSTV